MNIYYVAFTIGLVGSLHCVGMCGPLLLAAAGPTSSWRGVLSYQAGRILVYVALGGVLGGLGWGLRLWNAQGALSIFCGVLLLLAALLRIDPANLVQRSPAFSAAYLKLRARMGAYLSAGDATAQFSLGCCNGLLPCGLVYLAVVGAANTSSVAEGAGFMLIFGLGTLPLLLGSLFAGRKLFRLGAQHLATASALLMAATGSLLIYRGWISRLPADFQNFQDLAFPVMCH